MIDLDELITQLDVIDKDLGKKTRCETAKCTLKVIGIFVLTISFTAIGLLLQFLVGLKIAPYVCSCATILIVPFACKYSITILEECTDIKTLLYLAALERASNTIHTFLENHKEELENNDTN